MGNVLLVVLGALPFLGLVILASQMKERGADALAIADACVDWAYEPKARQDQGDPAFIAKCRLYFQTRSEADADQDDQRREMRLKRQAVER